MRTHLTNKKTISPICFELYIDNSFSFNQSNMGKIHVQLFASVGDFCCYENTFDEMFAIIRHYENTPMQYTAFFTALKNDNFQMENCDIFFIFVQNIDCGYT